MNKQTTIPTARPQPSVQALGSGKNGRNPWLNDHALLNLSVWWVSMTRPQTADFATDVAVVFESLQRDLQ